MKADSLDPVRYLTPTEILQVIRESRQPETFAKNNTLIPSQKHIAMASPSLKILEEIYDTYTIIRTKIKLETHKELITEENRAKKRGSNYDALLTSVPPSSMAKYSSGHHRQVLLVLWSVSVAWRLIQRLLWRLLSVEPNVGGC